MNWTKQMKDYNDSTKSEPMITDFDDNEIFTNQYVDWLEEKADKLDAILDRLGHSRKLFRLLISSVPESEPQVSERAQIIDEYIVELLKGIVDEEVVA
jgi:hypothetical protein